MYYLFGAGSNCYSVIGFIGKERIKGIVDNDISKIGKQYCDCQIISFDQFLKQYQGELVIISTFACHEEVEKQLCNNKVSNYILYPRLQTSYFSAKQIIDNWNLLEYKSICFFCNKALSIVISDYLNHDTEGKIEINNIYDYAEGDRLEILKKADAILVMEDSFDGKSIEMLEKASNVLWINKEIRDIFQKRYDNLKKFKNTRLDDKCFLIGNGPSLRISDLEVLKEKGIYTIGCNGIFEIFSETEWRPNCYVAADGAVPNERMSEIEQQDIPVFMKHFVGLDKEEFYLYRYQEYDYEDEYPRFSDDIVKCIYRSATVMFDMIQIAVYMGFKEIYLLGVDCNYIMGGMNNYFFKSTKPDTVIHRPNNMVLAYKSAKKYADSHGIRIYNATRGGKLEVFERIDFDSLFEQ